MKYRGLHRLTTVIGVVSGLLFFAQPIFAADSVSTYTANTLHILVLLATLGTTIFLIKGGYTYITSTGNPEALQSAKHTLRNALIGLIIVIGAATLSSALSHAFALPHPQAATPAIGLAPLQPAVAPGGLTQVLIDAFTGLFQNIITSATSPIINGIITFLTTTPLVSTNSVIFNFWLVIVGITDSLFAIVIALLGFQIMASQSFGFAEIDLKHLILRLGLGFLLANTSLFVIDAVIRLANVLIRAVLATTGTLTQAWIFNAFDPTSIATGTTQLITLVFMLLFLILAIVLLVFYISRLILIAVGAVLSPFIFLLWSFPITTDFAVAAIKSYLVTIFTVFLHVVTIQLASSFLSVAGQSNSTVNPLIAIIAGIGLFFTLLKIPGVLAQMAFYTSMHGVMRQIGGQVINVMHSQPQLSQQELVTRQRTLPV